MTAVLIDAARRNIGLKAMHAVVVSLPVSSTPKAIDDAQPAGALTTSCTGFGDKLFRGADGSESKYVVFVPRDYTGNQTVPAILYLHGSGRRGRDGRSQTIGGMAERDPG